MNSNSLHNIFDSVEEQTKEDREDNKDETASQEKENKLENTERKDNSISSENQAISSLKSDYSSQEESTDDEIALLQHQTIEEFPIDVDLDTEELYKELNKMSLNESNATFNSFSEEKNHQINNAVNSILDDKTNGIDNQDKGPMKPVDRKNLTTMDLLMGPVLKNDDDAGTGGLPFHLMCQPCTPTDYNTISNNLLSTISEDQPWDDESGPAERDREQHIRDLRALYAESAAMNQEDFPPLDYDDPLLKVFEAQYAISEQLAEQLRYKEQQEIYERQQLQYQEQQKELEREWNIAKHWAKAFGIDFDDVSVDDDQERKAPRRKDTSKQGLGHKETIFGVSFSDDGKYVATASQDATVGIWEVATNRLLSTLKGHDKNYECLRVDWSSRIWAQDVLDRSARFANLVASAGADGSVKLWACADKGGFDEEGRKVITNEWKCEYTFDHSNLLAKESNEGDISTDEKSDKPQVYSLQFIDHWNVFGKDLSAEQSLCSIHQESQPKHPSKDHTSEKNSFLMTSSDEFIHLWELERHALDQQLKLYDHKISILQDKLVIKEVMSLHFGPLEEYSYGVTACNITGTGMGLPPPPSRHRTNNNEKIAFGGERNPDNTIFVFDAAYCPGSGLLGVALADGSLRLVNGRGTCISVIHLPGNESHLTSFCWDKSGSRLATCVGTGHLITWSLDPESHQLGKYNTVATCTAIFEGGHQNGRPLFGSRYCGGEDENLLLSWGVDGKICMWYAQAQGNVYDPIAVLRDEGGYPIYAVDISPTEQSVVVGGGGEGGFIGVPAHFYRISPLKKRIADKDGTTEE